MDIEKDYGKVYSKESREILNLVLEDNGSPSVLFAYCTYACDVERMKQLTDVKKVRQLQSKKVRDCIPVEAIDKASLAIVGWKNKEEAKEMSMDLKSLVNDDEEREEEEEKKRKKEEERKLEEELKKRKEEEKRREEAKRLEEEKKRKEEVELKKRKEEEQRKQNEAEESKKIAEESKKSDTIQDSDSSLFEVEEASPKPLRSPIKIDESVLQTAQDTGNARGPSGLPLFNLDRIRDMNTTEEAAEATDSETETVSDSSFVDIDQPSPPPTLLRSNSQVDASILVSQLSQMDESSESDSDEDACREGEQEVKSAAATSFLSLLKRNKEIVSGVEANAKQATANLQPAQYRAKSKRTTCWSNPKEFLINYICRREVQGSYTFQNSKQIRLHSEYSE